MNDKNCKIDNVILAENKTYKGIRLIVDNKVRVELLYNRVTGVVDSYTQYTENNETLTLKEIIDTLQLVYCNLNSNLDEVYVYDGNEYVTISNYMLALNGTGLGDTLIDTSLMEVTLGIELEGYKINIYPTENNRYSIIYFKSKTWGEGNIVKRVIELNSIIQHLETIFSVSIDYTPHDLDILYIVKKIKTVNVKRSAIQPRIIFECVDYSDNCIMSFQCDTMNNLQYNIVHCANFNDYELDNFIRRIINITCICDNMQNTNLALKHTIINSLYEDKNICIYIEDICYSNMKVKITYDDTYEYLSINCITGELETDDTCPNTQLASNIADSIIGVLNRG